MQTPIEKIELFDRNDSGTKIALVRSGRFGLGLGADALKSHPGAATARLCSRQGHWHRIILDANALGNLVFSYAAIRQPI